MEITNEARDFLKKVFEERNATNIRIFIGSYSCRGPRVRIDLVEPQNNDKIETINEIKVAFEPEIVPFVEHSVLDYDEHARDFVLFGNPGMC